jgi:NAD(P)-dependent dehydrogenase (short-subunit alcohol dehydrogenase family)
VTPDLDQLLVDRVVAVTGASAGLGLAYAAALARAGARLILNGRSADQLARAADGLGGAAIAVAGDVSDPEVAEAIADRATEQFGRLDAVINNAGVLRDRTLLKTSDDEFDEVVRSHLYGTFYVGRACARVIRETGGGTILNIGSDSMLGAVGQSNYAAAKAAVVGLTLTWAKELARHGISCNCLLPNALTAMTSDLPALLADYRYGPPEAFPRDLGEATDVAPLIVLLCSDRWRHLTGQILGLGGDKLSLWEPPRETRVGYLQGGWTTTELDRSLTTVLGFEPPSTSDHDHDTSQRSLDGATHT